MLDNVYRVPTSKKFMRRWKSSIFEINPSSLPRDVSALLMASWAPCTLSSVRRSPEKKIVMNNYRNQFFCILVTNSSCLPYKEFHIILEQQHQIYLICAILKFVLDKNKISCRSKIYLYFKLTSQKYWLNHFLILSRHIFSS